MKSPIVGIFTLACMNELKKAEKEIDFERLQKTIDEKIVKLFPLYSWHAYYQCGATGHLYALLELDH